MIAYHSISTIADAYRKGSAAFDADFALKAMNDTINHGHDCSDCAGRPSTARRATSPATAPTRGAATAPACKNSASLGRLQICYNDVCIARFADAIGKPELGAESLKAGQELPQRLRSGGGLHGRRQAGERQVGRALRSLEGQFRRLHRGRRLADPPLLRPARCPGSDRVAGRRADVCRPPGRDVQQSHRQSVRRSPTSPG